MPDSIQVFTPALSAITQQLYEASSKFVWSQTEVNQIREAVDQLRQLQHRYINGRIKLGVQPSDLARTTGLSEEIILEIQQQIR